jgi:fucose 4-O-acetylase-like acetyltransferase
MFRTATTRLARHVYRPLRRAGQRLAPRPFADRARGARQPERYPALDHARLVLIALVVVGHLLEQLANSGPLAAALYRWIYLFHMPAFALVSGAVSKATFTRRRAGAIVTGLLIPYALFQTLYPAWDAWLAGSGDWSQGYATPYWLLWYLVSLACWRLLLPLFARLRFALPVAVAIALAAGTLAWIGYPLTLSRTLVFFPLFLLGYRLGAMRLQRLGDAGGRRLAATGVLAAALAGAWYLRDLDPEWLYAATGYAALQVAPWTGAGIRLALLVASALCALALLALMPRRAAHAGLGRRSLTAYLMHGFVVRALVAAGAFTWLAHALAPPVQMLLCAAGGVALAALLSTRLASRLSAPLTQPVAWLRDRGWPRRPGGREWIEKFKRLY